MEHLTMYIHEYIYITLYMESESFTWHLLVFHTAQLQSKQCPSIAMKMCLWLLKLCRTQSKPSNFCTFVPFPVTLPCTPVTHLPPLPSSWLGASVTMPVNAWLHHVCLDAPTCGITYGIAPLKMYGKQLRGVSNHRHSARSYGMPFVTK